MKKFLLVLIVACSCTLSADAYYNNVNNSYAYDIGYNLGYTHGASGRYAESNYNRAYDYREGYNDGYYDGQFDYYNRQSAMENYYQNTY